MSTKYTETWHYL